MQLLLLAEFRVGHPELHGARREHSDHVLKQLLHLLLAVYELREVLAVEKTDQLEDDQLTFLFHWVEALYQLVRHFLLPSLDV